MAGKILLVVSIVASGIRIGKAIFDEIDIDSEIEALEHIVDCLEEDLEKCDGKKKADIEKALKFSRVLLEDALDCKQNPGKKTILTSLCVFGEWSGAIALGAAGAEGGAVVGAVGGPVGAIAGALVGGIAGAVAGSEIGASAVENFRCDEDGIATEMEGSLIDFTSKSDRAKVVKMDANVYVGKGVEVGAKAALFQIQDESDTKSYSVGKAGANFGITDKGVDATVESKVIWLETKSDKVDVGVGLNLDTGIQATENKVQLSALGFGFSAEKGKGFTLKLPFMNLTFKD